MQERKYVPTKEVAAAVAVVAEGIASANGMDQDKAIVSLLHWFTREEATSLVMSMTAPRIRCPKCSRCVRANGTNAFAIHCVPCAVIMRRELPDERESL